jgi:exopolysaccharide production protein ExoZ
MWSGRVASSEFGKSSPAGKSPLSAELLSIQYLRALAAIAVVLFHAAKMTRHSFEAGAAGVDVFFVISGFLMWTIGRRYEGIPFAFLAKRAGRIVPLYWLLTLALAALALLVPPPFHGYGPKPSAAHLLSSMFFVPENGAPVIVAGWTLNFEVFFYLLFALSLLLTARTRLVALTATLIGLFVVGRWLLPTSPILVVVTSPLLLEFLGGVWLGKAWTQGIRLPKWAGAVVAIAGAVAIVEVPRFGIYPEAVRAYVWGMPALLVVGGALSLEPILRSRALKFLGDASYSIYLVHVTGLAWAGLALAPLHLPFALGYGVCVALAVGAGCLCHVFVEQPLLDAFHPRPGVRPVGPHDRRFPALARAAENADPA